MISNKQVKQGCALCIACILFILAMWTVSRVQSAPDFTLPVKEIPPQYR